MKRTSQNSRAVGALWVMLTVLVALAALINFEQRRGVRLPDDGVTWVDHDHGVEAFRVASQSPGANAGLEPGVRLRRINGVAVRQKEDVGRLLAAIGVWQRAKYGIEAGGVEFTVPLVVGAASRDRLVDYFLWALGVAYLALGVLVAARHRQRSMAGHFFAFCLASFVVYCFSYTGVLSAFDRFVYWADVWATLLAAGLFLSFCLLFPGSAEVSPSRRALGWGVFLPVGLMLAVHHGAASGVLETDLPLVSFYEWLDRIEYGLLGLYFLTGGGFLYWTSRRTGDVALRQQRRWMAVGALAGFVPFVALYVVPFTAGLVPGPNQSFAVLSLALTPIAFAYAIARHRLMDVELVLRRGLAYTGAAAALLAAFQIAFYFGARWLAPQASEVLAPLWVASVVGSALLFHPLRSHIQRIFERRHFRERYDHRRTLVDFASTLSTETNVDRVLDSLTKRLSETLDLARLAVFVADGPGDQETTAFRAVRTAGIVTGDGQPVVTGSTIDLSVLEPAASEEKPYLFFGNPRWHTELDPAIRSWLIDSDLSYFVPCRAGGRTVAYLALGRTQRGAFLSSEDLDLVQAVCGYFAIALENARLVRSLEQKAQQYERLKNYNENIVESLSVGILATGLDGTVEGWNAELELMLGISREDAIGRSVSDLLPANLARELKRVDGETGTHSIYKFRLRAEDFPAEFRPKGVTNGHKNGSGPATERIVDIAVAPLVSKTLEPIGRLVILDDVTERAELEDQLVQADKLSSIGLLAAGVAHEVNTPLAVISSYAQMLAKAEPDPAKQQHILEKITSQTFRASEIVNSLLNFSRTSTSELVELDLNRVVDDTLSLIAPQLEKSQVQVELALDPAAGAVRGNANKLQQVFLNLFLNARDAMPEGGRLRVRSELVGENGNSEAQVLVEDTGVGIDPDNLKRVFDPFFTTKGYQRGTGLGLAVSYGIVKEHSGTIKVESVPGQGSQFRVALPSVRKAVHA